MQLNLIILLIIWAFALIYIGFWSLYVLLPPVLSALGLRNKDAALLSTAKPAELSVAIIVPAHNMAAHIEECLNSIASLKHPSDRVTTMLIADHCTDDTADIADSFGVRVFERNEGNAGKTFALKWLFERLKSEGLEHDIYLVTDGTARLDSHFLDRLLAQFVAGEKIVVGHSIVDTCNQKWFARCLGLALVHRNYQNWCRQRLALSSLIEGRGMAYSRDYIDQYGWSLAVAEHKPGVAHPTEDWRHGVRVVEQGMRVAYCHDAKVHTPLRNTLAEATQQGRRWERGRVLNAMSHALRLLGIGLRTANARKVLAALDSIQPPVAILGMLCVLLATVTWLSTETAAYILLSALPLAAFLVYGIIVVVRGREDGISPMTLLWAPVYIAWRFTSFLFSSSTFDRSFSFIGGSRSQRPSR